MFEDDNQSVFDKKKKSGHSALVAAVREPTSALERAGAESFGKLARVVAGGADVQSDAQRLLFFLASYGEGDRIGKYAFGSGELVGLKPVTRMTDAGPIVTSPATPPSEEARAGLGGMSGSRLSDAATYLTGRGWAKLTHDGEFGIDANFHEVVLTDQGRAAAQGVVRRAASAGGGLEGGGSPDLFGDGPAAPAIVAVERDQLSAMLARARIAYNVEHAPEGREAGDDRSNEGMTTIAIASGAEFTFDASGKLVGHSVQSKPR